MWKKVLELDPNHLEAQERLVELLHQEGDRLGRFGDLDGALKSYREALTYTPGESYLYISLAECYFCKNDPDTARREMAQAFALNPADLDTYHMAVDACHVANRPDDAEWVITQATELAARLPAAFYLDLANCCFRRRQTEQGNDYVRRADRSPRAMPTTWWTSPSFTLTVKTTARPLSTFSRHCVWTLSRLGQLACRRQLRRRFGNARGQAPLAASAPNCPPDRR